MTDIQIDNIKFENDENLIESIPTVVSSCPKCSSKNSLIIMYRKDRYKKSEMTYSNFKIECIKCKWKVVDNFKWNPKQST